MSCADIKCCNTDKVIATLTASKKGCLTDCDLYNAALFSFQTQAILTYALPKGLATLTYNPLLALNDNRELRMLVDGVLIASVADQVYVTLQDVVDAIVIAVNAPPTAFSAQVPVSGTLLINSDDGDVIEVTIQALKAGTLINEFIFSFERVPVAAGVNCFDSTQYNTTLEALRIKCPCPEPSVDAVPCDSICRIINSPGELPVSGTPCGFIYEENVIPRRSTYWLWNATLDDWERIYRIEYITQTGLDFTEVSFDLLSGWELSLDGGVSWYNTGGIKTILLPAPVTVQVRNAATQCEYTGQRFEAEYVLWTAGIDVDFAFVFDFGSYGGGTASNNADLADFLQNNVTPQSGSGFIAGIGGNMWLLLLKGIPAPADWTYNALFDPPTAVVFGEFSTFVPVLSCLEASFTVNDASTWVPFQLLNDFVQNQLQVTDFYDQPAVEALVSASVTNMFGATASATVVVTGNDVVITILNSFIFFNAEVSSTEDYITVQNDPFTLIPCP